MTFPEKPTIASPYEFPDQPLTQIPLPTWASNGGSISPSNKVDPGIEKRKAGWAPAGEGLEYGQAPPYKWVNNEAYNNGQWATYFNAAIDYIKDGNLNLRTGVFTASSDITIAHGGNIIFNTANYYNYSGSPIYNTSTGILTAQTAGLYSIQFFISTGLAGESIETGNLNVNFVKNSSKIIGVSVYLPDYNPVSSSPTDFISFNYKLYLNIGETINFINNSFSADFPPTGLGMYLRENSIFSVEWYT